MTVGADVGPISGNAPTTCTETDVVGRRSSCRSRIDCDRSIEHISPTTSRAPIPRASSTQLTNMPSPDATSIRRTDPVSAPSRLNILVSTVPYQSDAEGAVR